MADETGTPSRIRAARWIFLIAGVYGLLVMPPTYFLEKQVGIDHPPAITHPEFYYGFVGLALAWQIAFIVIGRDPVRYRPLMLVGVVEKFSFFIAAMVLWTNGRLSGPLIGLSFVDALLGVLFIVAFAFTPSASGRAGQQVV